MRRSKVNARGEVDRCRVDERQGLVDIRCDDAESVTTQTQCSHAGTRCHDATMPSLSHRDSDSMHKVPHDDADSMQRRRCSDAESRQSQHDDAAMPIHDVTMPSLTRCRLDATMQSQGTKTTMPMFNATMPRDDAEYADCLDIRHDAWPHYGPMHDARRCRRSMHEDRHSNFRYIMQDTRLTSWLAYVWARVYIYVYTLVWAHAAL